MNDWYNDPPEGPEPPYCCDDYMVEFPDGVCVCETCGLREKPVDPYDGYEPPAEEPMPEPECTMCGKPSFFQVCDECSKTAKCRHGNPLGDCDRCDHESDLAYTASKESCR